VVKASDETHAERLARLEADGRIDPKCAGCREWYERDAYPYVPSHNASKSCESGKRNHCTCDRCW
jgi:hypothetical protein